MNLKVYPENFIIREYRKCDYNGLSALWDLTGMGNPLRGDDELAIEKTISAGGKLLILEKKESGTICGTSWMTYDGRRIHLHHFGILPDFQGFGLSKILLGASLDFVRLKGCQVKLEVLNTNKKAIKLYKSAGFTRLGDYDVYIIRDISKL